jgi:hypothetical protein
MDSDPQYIGCIGKCTIGLTNVVLNEITTNIDTTLSDPRGRKIFRKYLQKEDITDMIYCLDLYEMCLEYSENL